MNEQTVTLTLTVKQARYVQFAVQQRLAVISGTFYAGDKETADEVLALLRDALGEE
jgi:hypothetical protein